MQEIQRFIGLLFGFLYKSGFAKFHQYRLLFEVSLKMHFVFLSHSNIHRHYINKGEKVFSFLRSCMILFWMHEFTSRRLLDRHGSNYVSYYLIWHKRWKVYKTLLWRCLKNVVGNDGQLTPSRPAGTGCCKRGAARIVFCCLMMVFDPLRQQPSHIPYAAAAAFPLYPSVLRTSSVSWRREFKKVGEIERTFLVYDPL